MGILSAFSSYAFNNLGNSMYLFTSRRNNTRNFVPEYSQEPMKTEIVFKILFYEGQNKQQNCIF